MSANKPEDQATKQTGSNKDAEREVRDFDPDGQTHSPVAAKKRM